jgi:putative peptidoglycan lipid II flippase
MSDRFESNARTVTLLTLVSRITGLLRDASLSRVFGAAGTMDAFFFAFMIPNLFRRLFGEGALAAAFLPIYSRLDRDDPAIARQLASMTVALMVIVLGVITLAAEALLFALSAQQDHANLALWLTMIMLPYMPMVCIVAILGAMLQVHGKFGPAAAAPIVLNLLVIAAAVGLNIAVASGSEQQRVAHVGIVASSVILAGVIQVVWALWALHRAGQKWWVRRYMGARQHMRLVLRQLGPMILGLGVLQLNTFFDGLIASYPTTVGSMIFGYDYPLEEGAMAAISYAQRLYQFPLGVFGIAIATAIFPLLARQSDSLENFAATLRRGLRLVIYIGFPASVGLMLVREPLTAVILQGGDFSASDTDRVARVLLGYAPAIWAYSMIHVLTRSFYARGDARTPVAIAVGVVALNVILNCTLIWTPLREAGLAWSTSICSFVQAILLTLVIRRQAIRPIAREVLVSWGKTILATLVMMVVVWVLASLFDADGETAPAASRWSTQLLELAVLVIAGGAAYVVASLALRMPEMWWALGSARRDS